MSNIIDYQSGLISRIFGLIVIFWLLFILSVPVEASVFEVTSTSDRPDANPGNGSCRSAPEFLAVFRTLPGFLKAFFELFGPCTLRGAIQEANVLPGPDTVILPQGRFKIKISGIEENEAATGDLDITDDLVIIGSSVNQTIIDGNHKDRIFDIFSPSNVSISRLTLENGFAPANPEDAIERRGGAIFNSGAVTLQDIKIKKNTAAGRFSRGRGGGIYNLAGSMTLSDVLFEENQAEFGGGINNHFGNVFMRDVDFYRNQAFFRDADEGRDSGFGAAMKTKKQVAAVQF
jgi:CSLREA domain-containing protein